MILQTVAVILKNVMLTNTKRPFRPSLANIHSVPPKGDQDFEKLDESVLTRLKTLIDSCWAEQPGWRPSIAQALHMFDNILPDKYLYM